MLVQEILNKKTEYKIVKATSMDFVTKAEINGRTIQFFAVRRWGDGDNKAKWRINFKEIDKDGKETFDVTGSGGELEVLSMVKDSMIEFIDKYRPDEATFAAEKDGGKNKQARIGVYEKLLKRFKVPGYTFRKVDSSGSSLFVIEKEEDED